MSDRFEEGASFKQKRSQLPQLAPRDSRPTSTRDKASASSTGRPPRLSHRSRAGCWTCRGRKVKCDEIHPRCGPCTRLNRDCDWDHRWNFSDATPVTQGKYSNVNTSGNAVWDPRVRQSVSPKSPGRDDLPDFAALSTDEERERKAGTRRPGTFGVVVTPESFFSLPEYAATASVSPLESRRASVHSSRGGHHGSPRPNVSRSNTLPADPNTIILDKFEDASPITTGSFSVSGESRRGSFPDALKQLSISIPNFEPPGIVSAPLTPAARPDEILLRHFRHYIVPRLAQPQQTSASDMPSQGSTKEVLELEALRFRPLHHAICAISALNLAYNGRSSLEEAMQHYHQALSASATATIPNDLLSDGVFFRHFLLLIYDICVPVQTEDGGADIMWAEHLNHLRRIAIQRHQRSNGHEPYAHTLWTICELDMYACLMGSGSCDFVQMITSHNMLPPLEQQVPCLASIQTPGAGAFMPHEVNVFPPILHLNEGIVLRTAKLAQMAQTFRSEASSFSPHHQIPPSTYARWQATTTQLQTDLHIFWQHSYPAVLGPESSSAAAHLPDRVRAVFENVLTLYYAATIYSRTSMFPSQRLLPTADQSSSLQDTERRIQSILAVSSSSITAGHVDRRNLVFPLFIAGYASQHDEVKFRAVQLMREFEGHGIGQNTYRTRCLLVGVCEEQARAVREGRRMEDVEWIGSGAGVVNCGL